MRLAILACLLLCSCASRPIKLSGGLGPNASFEYGGGETKSLLSNLVDRQPEQPGTPPPNTAVIVGGENVRIDAHVQIGAPPVSTTTTITNNAPPGFSDILKSWLAPTPDNRQPEK